MRRTLLILFMAVLHSLPAAAQSDTAAPKEAVTIEIDSDLLRRARERNLDLGAMMETSLAKELGVAADAAPDTHRALLAAAFDNVEAMMFAPLEIDRNTPTAEVRRVCQSVNTRLEKLVAHAKAREAMALPESLEEAQELDQYLAKRLQAMQARMAKDGAKAQASGKIMEAKCPDLNRNERLAQQAMKTALGGYGPVGWCRAMMRKPQAQWTMDDGGKFAKFCQGVKPN